MIRKTRGFGRVASAINCHPEEDIAGKESAMRVWRFQELELDRSSSAVAIDLRMPN